MFVIKFILIFPFFYIEGNKRLSLKSWVFASGSGSLSYLQISLLDLRSWCLPKFFFSWQISVNAHQSDVHESLNKIQKQTDAAFMLQTCVLALTSSFGCRDEANANYLPAKASNSWQPAWWLLIYLNVLIKKVFISERPSAMKAWTYSRKRGPWIKLLSVQGDHW